MRKFEITGAGLAAVAVAVAVLWVCIGAEARLREKGDADARTSLNRLQQLRQRFVPASTEAPREHFRLGLYL